MKSWISTNDKLPDVHAGKAQQVIISILSMDNGKQDVLTAYYLNQYSLEDVNGQLTLATGWFTAEEEFYFLPIWQDSHYKITHWQPIVYPEVNV